MTLTDLQFQNKRHSLRIAPWLDMPLLREKLQGFFREQLVAHGPLADYKKEYKQDLLEFCDGKRTHIPRCTSVAESVIRVIAATFPISDTDQNRGEGTQQIFSHILQREMWSMRWRGGAGETSGQANGGFRDSDYEEGPEDCDGCGDCDECDRWDDD